MPTESNTRREVKAEIIRTMAEAEARGEDACQAARRTFPGIPGMLIGECAAELMEAETEAWWQSIERTIDGEVIREATAIVHQAQIGQAVAGRCRETLRALAES